MAAPTCTSITQIAVSKDLTLETQLQYTPERLQESSRLPLTGKGFCLQSVFRVQYLLHPQPCVYLHCADQQLWFGASHFLRAFATPLNGKKITVVHYQFTLAYVFVLGSILLAGPFAIIVQNLQIWFREVINIRTEKMHTEKNFQWSSYKCCYGEQHRESINISVFSPLPPPYCF